MVVDRQAAVDHRASCGITVTFLSPVCVLQVGNLGLLFMVLFFIFAALGVELFGELGKLSQLSV